MLKHDAQGFLLGDQAPEVGQSMRLLASVREDVHALRAAVAHIEQALSPHGQRVRSRAEDPTRAAITAVPSRALFQHPAAKALNNVAGGKNPSDGTVDPSRPSGSGMLHSVAGRLVEAVKASGSGMEDTDPAIKAIGEVAQPLARGYELLTGGDRDQRQEGLLRRIYVFMARWRKDDSAFNKAANKHLKAIEEKPAADGEGGGGWLSAIIGGLGALLAKIPGLGMLGGGAMAAAGGGLLGLGKGLLKRVPWLAALFGGVGALADVYGTETNDRLTRGEKDTRTGGALGRFTGSFGGLFAGAKLGALAGSLAGPIGTAIGAVVGGAAGVFFGEQAGQIVGEKIGGWVTLLREADIPGKIAGAWETTVAFLREQWGGVTDAAKDAWGWMQETWSGAVTGLSDIFDGIGKRWDEVIDWAKGLFEQFTGLFSRAYDALKDVPLLGDALRAAEEAAQKTTAAAQAVSERVSTKVADVTQAVATHVADLGQRAVSAVGAARDSVVEAGSNAIDRARQGASSAWEGAKTIGGKIGDRWNDARQYLFGASEQAGVDPGTVAKIAHFESGFNSAAAPIRRDGTRISSAHGYGQFLTGTWTDMLNKYGGKYGIEGAGTLTRQQAARYRNDKEIQAAMLAEFTRENVEKGRRYGGADDDANVYAFHNLGEGDARRLLAGMRENPSMTVREALMRGARSNKDRARVESVIAGNRSLYGDGNVTASEAYTRMGNVMRRGEVYATDIRQGQPDATVPAASPAAVASTSAPPAPKPPAAAPVAQEAPAIQVPLASAYGPRKPVVVSVQQGDVGQDVRDRDIAHIVTGGLSGSI